MHMLIQVCRMMLIFASFSAGVQHERWMWDRKANQDLYIRKFGEVALRSKKIHQMCL